MAYKPKNKKPEVSNDSFIRNLIANDDIASLADDGLGAAEFGGTIDTGSYALNALYSGSMYGGVADNKVTGFAGESSTGKTFFVLGVLKTYLEQNPTAIVVYYDTEAAVTKKMMKDRGIDVTRVILVEPETIQAFRTHAVKLLDTYMQADNRPPMLFVLDSLGMLPSAKEVADMLEGEDKRDMTKQQLIRGTFRVLTLRLAKAKVGMLLTQHTYEVVGAYVPTKAISGGGGAIYAASTIGTLSKKKDRDDKTKSVTGVLITVTMFKSRLSKENQKVEVLLTYDKGLDRYYGLLPICEKYGIFKKIAKKYELPDGTTAFESEIDKDGAKFFGPYMAEIEAACNQEFTYGQGPGTEVEEDVEAAE